jgi:putative DNA primase/helicase
MSQDLYKGWALYYASLGWAVFPLKPGTKYPGCKHGSSEATTDTAQIEKWWTAAPESGIGMRPASSGLYVFDMDPRNGGEKGFAELQEKHGLIASPMMAMSGRGVGFHQYFRASPDTKYLGTPAAGCDGKHNGFVVLPPSIHPDTGRPYEWLTGVPSAPVDLPQAPAFLEKPISNRKPSERVGTHADLPQLTAALEFIDPESYDDWWQTIASLKHWGEHAELEDLAFDLARDWSARSSKHDDGEFEWKWDSFDSFRKDCRTVGSLIAQARAAGFQPGPDPAICFPAALAASLPAVTIEAEVPQPLPELDMIGMPVESDQYQGRWFAQKGYNHFKYTHGLGWLSYDSTRWVADDASNARIALGNQFKGMLPAVAPSKKSALLSSGRLDSVLAVARDFPHVRVPADAWDAEPALLNTPVSAYNLATGQPVDRASHYFMQCTAVSPDFNMPTPVWDRVLQSSCPDHEFLMRALGYGITGSMREEMLFVLYGNGQNGKSKILECIKDLLGDYGTTFSTRAMMRGRFDDTKEEAKLRGKRFVLSEEIKTGSSWDEERVKNITSAATMTLKLMHKDAIEVRAQQKVFISTNYTPALDGTDFAMRRRMALIEFPFTVPEGQKDKLLPEKLRAEWPGILGKLIVAARDWHANGLQVPQSVIDRVGEYMDDNDDIQAWLDSECEEDPAAEYVTHELYRSYAGYIEASRSKPMAPQAFGRVLGKKGFAKKRTNKARLTVGLRLRSR